MNIEENSLDFNKRNIIDLNKDYENNNNDFQEDIEQYSGNLNDTIISNQDIDNLSDDLQLERIDSIKSTNDAIPDKFTGWGLTSVIGCALFNFNTWGANSAYALYYEEYLNHNIFDGATKYSYAIIGGLAFSSGLVFSPVINFMIGVIGIKQTIFIGILIYFAAIILASFSTKLWEIYCTQGV
ncbi:hypothetical protein C6P40_004619, partial [Pichia californica]